MCAAVPTLKELERLFCMENRAPCEDSFLTHSSPRGYVVFLTTLPLSHLTSITAFRVLHLVKDEPLLEGTAQRNQ